MGIQAVVREGRVQARFTVVRRPSVRAMPAASRKSQFPSAKRKSQRAMAPVSIEDNPALERASNPGVRLADLQPKLGPLDTLLSQARDLGATDVHVIAGRPMLARVGGDLLPQGKPLEADQADAMIREFVPDRLRGALEEQGSCDFAADRDALGRYRVNVSRQRTGLKACFRYIRPALPTLASLGLPPEIERATHHHQGLVVVTGPTGHGKTCTLAAIVDIINRETTHHVITVEDPVEYIHRARRP